MVEKLNFYYKFDVKLIYFLQRQSNIVGKHTYIIKRQRH